MELEKWQKNFLIRFLHLIKYFLRKSILLHIQKQNLGGGNFNGIDIISVNSIAKFEYDYIVIASISVKEITEILVNIGIDSQKIVNKDMFCPDQDDLNVSQAVNSYYLRKQLPMIVDSELKKNVQKFLDGCYFLDVLGRRRFFPTLDAIDKVSFKTEVFFDYESKLKYVYVNDKKLFYPGAWSDEKIQDYHAFNYYTCVDDESAHVYLTDSFQVSAGDTVADIGAAEGLFSLNIIDKVKKIYIFEADKEWIRPLEETFRNFKEKVIIVNKFITNVNFANNITLDVYFAQKNINLIKMDIEGFEQKALLGAKNLLLRDNIRWIIATYHRSEDMEYINAFMSEKEYITEQGKQWLWIDHEMFGAKPFGEFRKAMLRAYKLQSQLEE